MQPLLLSPALEAQVARVGAELSLQQPDHLTSRVVLRVPRVFVTA